MNSKAIFAGILILASAALALYLKTVLSHQEELKQYKELFLSFKNLESSIKSTNHSINNLKKQLPGLGEYMTGIQLHMAKLYFAAESSNWKLARYELHELEEAVVAAAGLHAVKNKVDISSVLESVLNAQISPMKSVIREQNLERFKTAYDQTLTACNKCHAAAGYEFIQIIRPASPPVTNQKWETPEARPKD